MAMDTKAEEFVSRLLSPETHKQPIDSGDLRLPIWYDEDKFKRGQEFFKKYFFGFTTSYIVGLLALFAVPSMIKVLSGTRKSSSPRTAYRRYWSTLGHLFTWVHHDLKPGNKCWESFQMVRKNHHHAMKGSVMRGDGIISQRDIALTVASGFIYAFLKPDDFGIHQGRAGDWDSYNHWWGVIAHLIGLQDRYNICALPFEETYKVIVIIRNRVFTPCLDNPPEYFEHMVRVLIEGATAFYPAVEPESILFLTKHLAEVPGYIYKESDRISLRRKLMTLNGNSSKTGVPTSHLVEKCAIEGLPECEPRLLYFNDYESVEDSPAYKQLPLAAKFKLAVGYILISFYSTFIGRVVLNFFVKWRILLSKYFPYVAIWKFGFVNVYKDIPDYPVLMTNAEYSKKIRNQPWYRCVLDFLM